MNLKFALGNTRTPRELKKIARQTYEQVAQMGVEIFRFPSLDKEYIDTHITREGIENIVDARNKGKGILFLTAHFGSWELLAIFSAIIGYPMKILAREQKYSRLNDLLNEFRATHGNEIIGKGMALREIVQALRNNEIVGILSDQSGGPDGVYAEFFGRRTTTPGGAISIAKRTGCVVLPSFIIRKPGGKHHVVVNPPLGVPDTENAEADVYHGVQKYLELLEKYARQYPGQWLWGHKRWKYTIERDILFLSDTKAGHESQLDAVKQTFLDVGREMKLDVRTHKGKIVYKSRFHRTLLFALTPFLAPYFQGRTALLRHFLTPESYATVATVCADIIVSCGASTVPLTLLLKHENAAKTIVIMKPPFPYDLFHFDRLFVPAHDSLLRSHKHIILLKTALNKVNQEKINTDGAVLKKELGLTKERIMSIFIGGDTHGYAFDRIYVEKSLDAILDIAKKENYQLLVTTSRRTRGGIVDLVKEKLAQHERCRLLVIPTEHNRDNIVSSMIGCAQLIMVTDDSISMISEAVQSDKNVLVLKMADGEVSKKHMRFQRNLAYDGLVTLTTHERIDIDVKQSGKQRNTTKRHQHDDTQRVKKAVQSLL